MRLLIDELMELKTSDDYTIRRASITLLSLFCVRTKADLSQFVAQLLRNFILLLNDPDPIVLKLSSDAIGAIVKVHLVCICQLIINHQPFLDYNVIFYDL